MQNKFGLRPRLKLFSVTIIYSAFEYLKSNAENMTAGVRAVRSQLTSHVSARNLLFFYYYQDEIKYYKIKLWNNDSTTSYVHLHKYFFLRIFLWACLKRLRCVSSNIFRKMDYDFNLKWLMATVGQIHIDLFPISLMMKL